MNKQVEQSTMNPDAQSPQTQSVKTEDKFGSVLSNEPQKQDSILSHLGYGLGMLIVMAIPPLLPGVTMRGLVMAYMAVVASIYSIVCVAGVVKALRPAKTTRTGRSVI